MTTIKPLPEITLEPANPNYQLVVVDGEEIGAIWRFLGTWRSCRMGSAAKGFDDPMVAATEEWMAYKTRNIQL